MSYVLIKNIDNNKELYIKSNPKVKVSFRKPATVLTLPGATAQDSIVLSLEGQQGEITIDFILVYGVPIDSIDNSGSIKTIDQQLQYLREHFSGVGVQPSYKLVYPRMGWVDLDNAPSCQITDLSIEDGIVPKVSMKVIIGGL